MKSDADSVHALGLEFGGYTYADAVGAISARPRRDPPTLPDRHSVLRYRITLYRLMQNPPGLDNNNSCASPDGGHDPVWSTIADFSTRFHADYRGRYLTYTRISYMMTNV